MTSTNALKNGSKLFLMIFSLLSLSFYSKAQVQCKLAFDIIESSIVYPTDGGNHGAFAFTMIGGTAPYTVEIMNGNHQTLQPNKVFYSDLISITGLPRDYWWLMVTDANGCMVEVDLNGGDTPCTFVAQYSDVHAATPGQSNGSFTVTAIDGVGPYTATLYDMAMNIIPGYANISIPSLPYTFTGLPSNYYWLGILDSRGCYGFVDVDLQCYQNCAPVKICTYTQGYYGVAGGQNQHLNLINSILTAVGGSFTIGLPGHSVLINSAQAVIDFLPAGGPSAVLPAGDGTLGTGLYGSSMKNQLLAQTLTLGLNWRIPGSLLATVPLNGLVSAEIVNALADKTVAGLYTLANYALAGETLPPGVTLSEISDAVTAINEYFDECRSYTFPLQTPMVMARGAQSRQAQAEAVSGDLTVVAGPNPFQSNIRFVIKSKVSGNAELGLYNLSGAKVAVPFRGHVSAGQTQTVDYTVPSTLRGGMMYMLKVGNKVTSGKLVSGNR